MGYEISKAEGRSGSTFNEIENHKYTTKRGICERAINGR
jgi:hypothetical protein